MNVTEAGKKECEESKRGKGGQGREGVQLPESLMDEAAIREETVESPGQDQQTEEAVRRVGGITCNAEGFAGETGAVNALEGG